AAAVLVRLQDQTVPVDAFMANIKERRIARVPGTALFLTRTQRGAPPVMVWHVRYNRALHERLFVLTIITESVPWVRGSERLTVQEQATASGGPPPISALWSGQTSRRCCGRRIYAAARSICRMSPTQVRELMGELACLKSVNPRSTAISTGSAQKAKGARRPLRIATSHI